MNIVRPIRSSLCTVSLLLLTLNVQAANADVGKELHDSQCTSCHDSIMDGDGTGIYTRKDRRIESLPALDKQVRRCKNSLGTSWPEDQINAVVKYLNRQFYHFPE